MRSAGKGTRLLYWLFLGIGYLLSPLSWWNDLFLNLPLAYLFGCLVALISPRLFTPGVVLGYWLSNLAGFVLMHCAALHLVPAQPPARHRLGINLAVSLGYTLLVVVLIRLNLLKPFWLYRR